MTATGCAGGIGSAWLSVGVGECMALLLLLMRISLALAVAVGVYTSALSVLAGGVRHIALGAIVLEVVLFAGQAALIGG